MRNRGSADRSGQWRKGSGNPPWPANCAGQTVIRSEHAPRVSSRGPRHRQLAGCQGKHRVAVKRCVRWAGWPAPCRPDAMIATSLEVCALSSIGASVATTAIVVLPPAARASSLLRISPSGVIWPGVSGGAGRRAEFAVKLERPGPQVVAGRI